MWKSLFTKNIGHSSDGFTQFHFFINSFINGVHDCPDWFSKRKKSIKKCKVTPFFYYSFLFAFIELTYSFNLKEKSSTDSSRMKIIKLNGNLSLFGRKRSDFSTCKDQKTFKIPKKTKKSFSFSIQLSLCRESGLLKIACIFFLHPIPQNYSIFSFDQWIIPFSDLSISGCRSFMMFIIVPPCFHTYRY